MKKSINDMIAEGKISNIKDYSPFPIKAEDIRSAILEDKKHNDMIKESKVPKVKDSKCGLASPYSLSNLTGTNHAEYVPTIESVCDGLKEFLLAKNKNYGNSASEPVRVFSKSNANEGILVRMDDKLSRIKNSDTLRSNDIVDLCGYLVLLLKNNGWDNFMDMVD